MSSNPKICNILLFGESGAGKSTTINALANYLQYSSLDQADSEKFVTVIPSKITLTHPKTNEQVVYKDAYSDPNEHHNDDGHSVTQSAKNYDFPFRGKTIRIIDTPGMGDTGGLEVDKRNFENILEHLKTLESLHGICFLIKTNTTRKTATFRYCLNQLMTQLPRSACANIVFCFTFSRNSLYGPGDGFATLREYFRSSELGGERIELKGNENCFYIDNEAFRYLLAKKHGYPFADDTKRQFLESWNKSAQQTLNMITRIVDNFVPFRIETIFLLKDYRKFVQEFIDPINAIKSKIQKELENIEEQERRAKSFNNDRNSAAVYQQNLINKKALIKSYNDEFELIQEFIRKLLKFLVVNLNFNCHNLIRPHLSLFTNDGQWTATQVTPTYQQNSPNFSKRLKTSSEQAVQTSPASLAKTEKIIELIRKNPNQINIRDLKQSGERLVNLKYSGNQISKILGIVPKLVSSSSSTVTSTNTDILSKQNKRTGIGNNFQSKYKNIQTLNQLTKQPTKSHKSSQINPSTLSESNQTSVFAEVSIQVNIYPENSQSSVTQPKRLMQFPENPRDSRLDQNNNFAGNSLARPIFAAQTAASTSSQSTTQPITNQPIKNPNLYPNFDNPIDHYNNGAKITYPELPKNQSDQATQRSRVDRENSLNQNCTPKFDGYSNLNTENSNQKIPTKNAQRNVPTNRNHERPLETEKQSKNGCIVCLEETGNCCMACFKFCCFCIN